MYEAVGNSPAQVLEMGMDSVGIVMAYGLHDEENKTFIDWEKGESHLMEEPFLELMAFAKEYGDREEYPRSETGERLAACRSYFPYRRSLTRPGAALTGRHPASVIPGRGAEGFIWRRCGSI